MSVQLSGALSQPTLQLPREAEGKFTTEANDGKVAAIAARSIRPPLQTIVSQLRPPKEDWVIAALYDDPVSSESEVEFADDTSSDESELETLSRNRFDCSGTVEAIAEFSLSEPTAPAPAAPRLRAKSHPDAAGLEQEILSTIGPKLASPDNLGKILKRTRETDRN